MKTWSRDEEVVHTSTFAGAPLACATALATLDCLNRGGLVERAAQLGSELRAMLASALEGTRVQVRGAGMMLGLDLAASGFAGPALQKKLLEKGYLTSTGGGARDVLVLTPSLVIQRELLEGFCTELRRIFTD
jgi:acetylornithine/succinyldiaminopimelate/putrescine aminotransferase